MKALINNTTAGVLYSKLLNSNKVTCRQVCRLGIPEWFYTKHYKYSKDNNGKYVIRTKSSVPGKCLDDLVKFIRINLEPSVQVIGE